MLVAMSEVRRSGRSSTRLDRELILQTAQAMADREGMQRLTLRGLGRELHADATAVYRHFRNKAELVSAMIDRLFSEVPEPDPAVDWRANLRELLITWWGIYRRHEGLAQTMAGQPDDEPRLFHLTEWTLRELVRAGVPPEEIGYFHQAVYNHAVGHGLVSAFSPWLTTPELRDEQRRKYGALDPARFPSSAAAAPKLYPETREAYLFSVELLLDVIQARARRSDDSTS